jgi:hypothetical protein
MFLKKYQQSYYALDVKRPVVLSQISPTIVVLMDISDAKPVDLPFLFAKG